MSTRASFGFMLSVAAALAATACGNKDDKAGGATGSASREPSPAPDKAPAGASASGVASSASAAAPAGAPAKDAKGLCLEMCDRAVECAPEIATHAGAKMGVEVPAAAIEEAKKQAAGAIEACKKGCGEDAAKATPSALDTVAGCLARPCSEYLDCMTKAAGMQ
ncbi:MAG: hypothetical protein HY908_24000 [Myxococcales bacterium]|nr:hypothetical protein [Myxococcales bacterium]